MRRGANIDFSGARGAKSFVLALNDVWYEHWNAYVDGAELGPSRRVKDREHGAHPPPLDKMTYCTYAPKMTRN